MKELLDDRTSGVVVYLLVRTSGVVVCLLVVHALLVIGGNRTMDVDRSVVHAPSLGKSMKRPQSSQWVAFVRELLLRVFVVTTRPRRLLAMGVCFMKEAYRGSGDQTDP